MTMKQLKNVIPGEIWIVKLSIKTEDAIGHETQKTRPCLTIANHTEGKMITIIPLQSNLNVLNIPYTYMIKKNQQNRLKNDSVAVIFQIRSLDYKRFQNKVGIITKTNLAKIKSLLGYFLDL
jgi:mRNA-degrading endonuclease toxin of MazEF toxin-antitoxin module